MESLNTILIVGGSVVGLFTARLLSGQGFHIKIIDPTAAPAENTQTTEDMVCDDPSVYTLSPATAELLQSIGVWDDFLARQPCPYHSMTVWDSCGTERIQIQAEDAGRIELGFVAHRNTLMNLLSNSLKQQTDIKILNGVSLTGLETGAHGLVAKLSSNQSIPAGLVIGADGTHSKTRQLAKLPMHQWSHQEKTLVVAVDLQSSHQNTARQVFGEYGCIGILPVGQAKPGRVVIVWSTALSQANQLISASDDELRSALAVALEIKPSEIKKIWVRREFPLNHCYAWKWFKPSVALVGDAAHSIHPLAGQGLNIGLEDAAWLAHLIIKKRKQRRQSNLSELANSKLLGQYQSLRMARIGSMIAFVEGIRFGFNQQSPSLIMLRNRLLNLSDRSGQLKSMAVKIASGSIPDTFRQAT